MGTIGEHATVLGGSLAGLLNARALAEAYERVTVVERDAALRRRPVPDASPSRPHA
jgi:2-polyprenyl-6-methoxyphenol hydroxylase-like FAD-dependent oxidoreductase